MGPSSLKWALFLPGMGPRPQAKFSFIYLFIFVNLGPTPENNGLNPVSFQFLVGGYLGPPKGFAPPWTKSWLRPCGWLAVGTFITSEAEGRASSRLIMKIFYT